MTAPVADTCCQGDGARAVLPEEARIGIGTYALFWEASERNPQRLTPGQMLDRAAELGCEVFQICDDPVVAAYDDAALTRLADHAASLGLALELGTRGTDPDHLRAWVRKARLLGARTLRSMVQAVEVEGGLTEVVDHLRSLVPDLEASDVTLALETYEQVPTAHLVTVVRAVASPRVGICLDPANCVSALERPADVVAATAPYVTNLHVKDFAFTRNPGWVGFLYAGARLGEGLLDLDAELAAVYPAAQLSGAPARAAGTQPSAVVEHWVPWQGDVTTTIALEQDWTRATLEALRRRRPTAG